MVKMKECKLIVQNRAGIHARPAAKIVNIASGFSCDIIFDCMGSKVNAKSIMGILTLGAAYKATVVVSADGPDEKEAIAAIESLFLGKFDDRLE